MKLSPEECQRLNRERCTFKRGVRLQFGTRERAFAREPSAKEPGTTGERRAVEQSVAKGRRRPSFRG